MPENVQYIQKKHQIDKGVEMYWFLPLLNYSSYKDDSMVHKDFQLNYYKCYAKIDVRLELMMANQ